MTTTMQLLIPALVPLAIALTKLCLPSMPRWLPPLLAPVLGAAAELLSSGALTADTGWAAVLGSAGVGLREIVDQLRQAVAPPPE